MERYPLVVPDLLDEVCAELIRPLTASFMKKKSPRDRQRMVFACNMVGERQPSQLDGNLIGRSFGPWTVKELGGWDWRNCTWLWVCECSCPRQTRRLVPQWRLFVPQLPRGCSCSWKRSP